MSKRNPCTVGEMCRNVRLELDLTQEEEAHLLGVSAITVSRWERDAMVPGLDTLRRLFHLEASKSDAA
jgi:transcriptional regulator with XRE-family HTH domain